MSWNRSLEETPKHAIFSPSSPWWLNDTDEEIVQRYCSSFASSIGTILHDMARKHIEHSVKLVKSDKKYIRLSLLEASIPESVITRLPDDDIFETLMMYVNDCIGYRMIPEQKVEYSELFFGTCDAVRFEEREKLLRISDFKSGTSPAKMEQLICYDALYRLQHCQELRIRPEEIRSELRIYQCGEIRLCTPEPDEIISVMEFIKAKDNLILNL